MNITRSRVIMGDLLIVVILIMAFSSTKVLSENLILIGLVLVILIARSIWYHVMWYKSSGKIY
ncbi:MAG TPA: hypothetical protein VHS53_12590 [Mucilaginibacter sp.]|nr:hypothetical protein [Mucilaginibacter sp.]